MIKSEYLRFLRTLNSDEVIPEVRKLAVTACKLNRPKPANIALFSPD